MSDFSKPASTDTYTNVLAYLKATIADLALGMDPANTTPTNVPTNAVRWNSANNRFEKYNGTVWAILSTVFAFQDLSASGTVTLSGGTANGVPYLNASKQLVSGSALTYSGGNLGVGGTASNGVIEAIGTSGNTLLAASTTSNASKFGSRPDVSATYIGSTAYPIWLNTESNQPIQFYINSAEGMRLTSTGLVVGNTSYVTAGVSSGVVAATALVVGGQSSGADGMYIRRGGTAITQFQTTDGGASSGSIVLQPYGGNVGLGVTPNTALVGVFQLGANKAIESLGNGLNLFSNHYYSAGDKFAGTGYAMSYQMYGGVHSWYTSTVSGAAGGAITFNNPMTLDASGNLGLAVTPSAWSGNTVFQNKSASMSVSSNGNNMDLATNYYYNGTNNIFYQSGNYALMYEQASGAGAHRWFVSTGTGTAGNPITFTQAMTLDASGNLSTLTSSAGGYIQVQNTANTNTAKFRAANSQSWVDFAQDGSGGYIEQNGAYAFRFYINGSERARIHSSGGVSIGNTTDPGATNLSVSGTIADGTATLRPLVAGTSQATTSGTTKDFTGIPSWAKKITVVFQGVSTNGTSNIIVQLGTSGGQQTTGYAGAITSGNNGVATYVMSSNGFDVAMTLSASAIVHAKIEMVNITGNTWVMSGSSQRSDTTTYCFSAGSVSLSAALTTVRITTAGGANAFDAGNVNIIYE